MEYISQNCDVEGSKEFYKNLAQTGYVQELNKNGNQVYGKGKGRGKNTAKNTAKSTAKNKPKEKCADCNKMVGTKAAIQCDATT